MSKPIKLKPTCAECGDQHWNFVACDQADDANATEEANTTARAEQSAAEAARLGHINQFAGIRMRNSSVVAAPGQPLSLRAKRKDGRDQHGWGVS